VGIAFRQGDILFGKLRPYLAKVYQAEFAGEAIGDFHVMRPVSGFIGRYALYQFLQESFISVVDGATHGAKMPRVGWEFMGNMPFVVPRPEEQLQIARFLSHETAKIDALIREQERLIALLQEKRQAVISHAVTKGLDPNVPMKDSGVEWLGEVPAHWVVTPLKRCSKLNPSKSGYLGSKSIDCTFLPMEKLKTDTIRRDEIRKISEVYDGYTYFEDGDVLFAKVTPCFENRNTALACYLMNGIGFGSSEIFVLRPETGIVGRFLFYRLLEDVLVNYWSSEMTGAGGLKRVPSSVVENFAIALPDRAEQEHICAYLDTAVKKFEELMAEAESAVALLKERRSALISAAVTGKIDVRNWQPPVDESAFDEEVRQAGMEVTA
tara:strand:+ start:339 stop:1478 length:1140 start_codon:yes stop_codon:yes gene_type:complete